MHLKIPKPSKVYSLKLLNLNSLVTKTIIGKILGLEINNSIQIIEIIFFYFQENVNTYSVKICDNIQNNLIR